MRRFLLSSLVVVAVMVPLAFAHAQNADTNANANANATASANATNATSAATDSPTSMTTSSGRSATGYGYSDPKPAGNGLAVRSGTRAPYHRTTSTVSGPIATLPGFEMVGDGGSRLFVELSQNVQVDERRAHGSITYVMHGAHVTVHNNTNALVTTHFNTPVSSARLVQAGRDLLFVVALRADAQPTWKLNPGKEGSSVLTIDFAKGSYLSATAP